MWKNGAPVALDNGGTSIADVSNVVVAGKDVYVCGSVKINNDIAASRAVYWKNGKIHFLTDGKYDSDADAICVSDGDVYVAGTEFSGNIDKFTYYDAWDTDETPDGLEHCAVAKYWKNGKEFDLTDGKHGANVSGIAVVGGDVYVAGVEAIGKHYSDMNEQEEAAQVATVWKNGKAIRLTDGKDNYVVSGMAVVQK
jgi:hypothetical protein